jgi:multidrug efflux system outer membrane protein
VQVTGWEADLFGRLRSLGDAAQAQVLASVEARKAVQVSLVAAVAAAHLALVADDSNLAVTQQALATREATLKLVQLRFDSMVPASDVDLRQASRCWNRRAWRWCRPRASARWTTTRWCCCWASRCRPTCRRRGRWRQAAWPELPVGLPSDVLVRRPDVRQAEQALIAANANIGAARAALLPRITLTGSAGSVSAQLSGLLKAGSFGWALAPQLLQTVFDAGRNQANLQAATVNRDIALAQYEKALQTAFREVADALAGRATLAEQRDAQQRLVQAEAARAALAELRYRNGAASHLELLDAQRSLLAAQQGLVQVQLQVAQNATTLFKVLGGGWQAAG